MDSAGERFAAIQEALADRKNILTVKELCELAGVSRSGYYNWVRSERARETREQKDQADFERILEAYRFRGYAKGARGIHMRLLHMGVRMNVKKIRRLMRKYRLTCPPMNFTITSPQVSTPLVCCRNGSNKNVLDLGCTL